MSPVRTAVGSQRAALNKLLLYLSAHGYASEFVIKDNINKYIMVHDEMEELTPEEHSALLRDASVTADEMEELTPEEQAMLHDASVTADDPDAHRNLIPNAQPYLVDPAARQSRPFSAARLGLHPEASRLTENFSLLLSLQEMPEIFENIWRLTGPPDVGNLAVVPERPLNRHLVLEPARHSYTPQMQDMLMHETPMLLRNWNALEQNLRQIQRRLEDNRRFFNLFQRLDVLFDGRFLDPMTLHVKRQLHILQGYIPDITSLARLSYDEVESRLHNFMVHLQRLEIMLGNNIFSFVAERLDQSILHGLQYTILPPAGHNLTRNDSPVAGNYTIAHGNYEADWNNYEAIQRLEIERIGTLLEEYHTMLEEARRPDSQPTTIWSPNSEFSSEYDWGPFDQHLQRILISAENMRNAQGIIRETLDMRYQSFASFLDMVRDFQAFMDDDSITGLGGIANQFVQTVMDRLRLMREERANAFSRRRGEYQNDYTRGYVSNLLPTVNRDFDQVSRGFHLGRRWVPLRPTYYEWFSRHARDDSSSDGDDSGDSNEHPSRPSRIATQNYDSDATQNYEDYDSGDNGQNSPAAPSPTSTLQYENAPDEPHHPSRESTLSYDDGYSDAD